MGDFRKLRVWQQAESLAVETHRVSERMRGDRSRHLRDQLQRASMSVPSNIVEGAAHESTREFARYLRYALASASEVEGHIQLGRDLNLVSEEDYSALISLVQDVRMMLCGLLKKLKQG